MKSGPVVLIEVGFITNAQNVKAIKEQTLLIASQTAEEILRYLGNEQ